MKKTSQAQSKECLKADPKDKTKKSKPDITHSKKHTQEFPSQSNIYHQPHTAYSQVKIFQYPSAQFIRHHESYNYSRQLYDHSHSKPRLQAYREHESVPMLRERLKNIHEHYEALIQE